MAAAATSASKSSDPDRARRYVSERASLAHRLHRIEGQVRGIERMLEEKRDCLEVLAQVRAATNALESLAAEILNRHVRRCITGALTSGDHELARAGARELITAIERFTRGR